VFSFLTYSSFSLYQLTGVYPEQFQFSSYPWHKNCMQYSKVNMQNTLKLLFCKRFAFTKEENEIQSVYETGITRYGTEQIFTGSE
jgi:hypothetical protein